MSNSDTRSLSSGTEVTGLAGAQPIRAVPVARLRAALDALQARSLGDAAEVAIILGTRSLIMVMPGGNGQPAHQIGLTNDKCWDVGPGTAARQIGQGPKYSVAAVTAWIGQFSGSESTEVVSGQRDFANVITLGTLSLQPIGS